MTFGCMNRYVLQHIPHMFVLVFLTNARYLQRRSPTRRDADVSIACKRMVLCVILSSIVLPFLRWLIDVEPLDHLRELWDTVN